MKSFYFDLIPFQVLFSPFNICFVENTVSKGHFSQFTNVRTLKKSQHLHMHIRVRRIRGLYNNISMDRLV